MVEINLEEAQVERGPVARRLESEAFGVDHGYDGNLSVAVGQV